MFRARTAAAVVVLAAAVALPLSTAAAGAASTSIRDSVLSASGVRMLSASSAFWGGALTASTGERVTIRVSDSYPQDPAFQQHWADFLASLLHGSELQTVTVYLAPLREVQSVCGRGALACYSQQGTIFAPADNVSPEISAESVVMHEYGHHVANSRNDAPWDAIDYGTKRWSSYEQVCARARAGQLFPGAEDAANYQLNPGEAFAETYRVVNERRLGRVESVWDIVSDSLYPDETAISLVTEDVTTPWTGNTSATSTLALSKRVRTKNVAVATPLDGLLRVTVRGVRNARVAVDVFTATGARAARTVVTGAVTRSVDSVVCGTRSYRVRLTLQRGAGSFQLAASKP